MAGGVETTNGEVHSVTGDVTYSVSPSCNASGTVTWSTGFTSHFKFYLDDVDTAPETYSAIRKVQLKQCRTGVAQIFCRFAATGAYSKCAGVGLLQFPWKGEVKE